jgi:hypothetical protein
MNKNSIIIVLATTLVLTVGVDIWRGFGRQDYIDQLEHQRDSLVQRRDSIVYVRDSTLMKKYAADSLEFRRMIRAKNVQIRRLVAQSEAVDYSAASAPKLDSIIEKLYP